MNLQVNCQKSDKNLVFGKNNNQQNQKQLAFTNLQQYYKFENEMESQENDPELDETDLVSFKEKRKNMKMEESSSQFLINQLNDSQSQSPKIDSNPSPNLQVQGRLFEFQQQVVQESKAVDIKIDIQTIENERNISKENQNKQEQVNEQMEEQNKVVEVRESEEDSYKISITKNQTKETESIQTNDQDQVTIQKSQQEVQKQVFEVEPIVEVQTKTIESKQQEQFYIEEPEVEIQEEMQNSERSNSQQNQKESIGRQTFSEENPKGELKGSQNEEQKQEYNADIDLAAWVNEMEPSIDEYSESYSQRNDESFFKNLIQETKEEHEIIEIQKEIIQIEQTLEDGKVVNQRETQKSLESEVKVLKKGEGQQIISQFQNKQEGNQIFKSEEKQVSSGNRQIQTTTRVKKEELFIESEDNQSERSIKSQASSQNAEQNSKTQTKSTLGKRIPSPQVLTKKK